MQLRLLSFAASPLALLLALLPLSGCPASLEEGEEDVGDTSTGETGTGETGTGESESAGEQGESSSETAGETAMGTESTTSDPGTETTSETGTGTDSTTGDPPPDVEQACMAACEVFSACIEPFPECLQACIDAHLEQQGECLDAELALTNCIAGLTCEEVQQFVASDPVPYPCQAEEAAVCDAPVCEAGVGVGENPGECSFDYICPNDPIYEVVCDGSTCSCLEDGVEVGGCSDAAAFCAADDFNAASNECCGWAI